MDFLSEIKNENLPYVEHIFGLVLGTGQSSGQRDTNTALLNAAVAANGGTLFRGRRGAVLEVGERIKIPSNGGIIGDTGKGAKFRIDFPAVKFSNTDNTTSTNGGITAGRYGPTSVGIDFSGVSYTTGLALGSRNSNVRLTNIHLNFEVSSNRILRAVVGRNIEKCFLDEIEVSGLPNGIGICLASAKNCYVGRPHIRDGAVVGTDSTYSQLTGIEIDNDTLNGFSSDVTIFDPTVHDLVATGGTVDSVGWQTDGIQIVNKGTLRIKVIGGSIRNVGEGIDWYGSHGLVTGTVIENTHQKALKLIHGASYNTFSTITIQNSGLAHIALEGSNVGSQDVRGNLFSNINARGVNHKGSFTANENSGVLIGDGTSKNYDNLFMNCYLDGGGTGKNGWLDTGTGTGNYGDGIKFANWLNQRISITNGGGGVREVGSSGYAISKSVADPLPTDITVPNEAYGVGWDNDLTVPTKNALYLKFYTLEQLIGTKLDAGDGDKGDISISGGSWLIDNGAVTLAKMANVASGVFLGRVTAGAGVPEQFSGSSATALLDVATGSLNGLMSAAQFTKLAGIATGATANSSDAFLLARANHTGTQAPATIQVSATSRIIGRVTAAAGPAEELTGAQVTALLSTVVAAGAQGVMTGADKTKLDGIAAGATNTGDWTYLKLASDVTNSNIAAVDLTGQTFTPDISSDYEFEFHLDCYGGATTTGPQPVISWSANISYGSCNMYSPASVTSETVAHAAITASAGTLRGACLGLPVANVAYGFKGGGRFRTNASAQGAFKLQIGAEVAALVGVKAGSFLKYRKI